MLTPWGISASISHDVLTAAPSARADAKPRPSANPPEAMYGMDSSLAARASFHISSAITPTHQDDTTDVVLPGMARALTSVLRHTQTYIQSRRC